MFSAPLGRGRSVRDYVQGYVRPACELWMSRVVPLVMFSAPLGRGRGERDCVWGCMRPVCGADVYPRYVFGTPGTMPGHSRLRVGLCEACVRGVGARVGTLIVLLHDLRACHSAYASGLVSQGRLERDGPVPQLSGAKLPLPCAPPGQLCLWSSVWVLFAYYLPTPPL